jgi:hypothetical protein
MSRMMYRLWNLAAIKTQIARLELAIATEAHYIVEEI